MRLSQTLSLISLVTAVYLFAFAIVFWMLMPVQAYVTSNFAGFAEVTSLVTLTHGVRVTATWLFRWKAILLLAPGIVVEAIILSDHYALTSGDLALLIAALSTNSFVAFEVLRVLGWPAYADREHRANWRPMMMAGILATAVNAALLAHLNFNFFEPHVITWIAVTTVVGGTVGLFVWLLLLRAVLRAMAGAH